MKKHIVSILAVIFFAAFASVSFGQAQVQATVPAVFEKFEVIGKKSDAGEKFVLQDYLLETKVSYEQVLAEHASARKSPGRDFLLMKVTTDQWTLLESKGVKLTSLWDGDVRRDWIEMKFGYIGPILADCDGKPGFVLKNKKGEWSWTYRVQEIEDAVKFFWIAVDTRALYLASPEKAPSSQ